MSLLIQTPIRTSTYIGAHRTTRPEVIAQCVRSSVKVAFDAHVARMLAVHGGPGLEPPKLAFSAQVVFMARPHYLRTLRAMSRVWDMPTLPANVYALPLPDRKGVMVRAAA